MNFIKKSVWFALFFIIIAGPAAVLFYKTAAALLSGNMELISYALPQGRRLALLLHSLGLASAVAAGGAVFGFLGGSFLYQWRTKAGMYVRYTILLLAVVPPYVHALSWSSAITYLNDLFKALYIPAIPEYGFFICWWVELTALMPICIGTAIIGFELMQSDLVDAGRVFNNNNTVLYKVVMPLAAPAIATGSAFVFLISLMDYSIPSLFQINVYSLEIFAQYSMNYRAEEALILAVPLFCSALLFSAVFQLVFRNAGLLSSRFGRNASSLIVFPKWFAGIQRITVFILLLQVAAPVVTLISVTGTFKNVLTALYDSGTELSYSILIALLSAGLCIPFAIIAAHEINRGALKAVWGFAVILPFAIPAPLVGIGLISMWNRPVAELFYGTMLMPVLAGVIRFIPFAVMIMLTAMKRIDPLLLDAAKTLQKNALHGLTGVTIPLLMRGILAAGSLVFALTFGELGATLIVVPAGMNTLSIKIYNYMHYGASGRVAALCLIMLVLSILMGLITVYLLSSGRRSSEA